LASPTFSKLEAALFNRSFPKLSPKYSLTFSQLSFASLLPFSLETIKSKNNLMSSADNFLHRSSLLRKALSKPLLSTRVGFSFRQLCFLEKPFCSYAPRIDPLENELLGILAEDVFSTEVRSYYARTYKLPCQGGNGTKGLYAWEVFRVIAEEGLMCEAAK